MTERDPLGQVHAYGSLRVFAYSLHANGLRFFDCGCIFFVALHD